MRFDICCNKEMDEWMNEINKEKEKEKKEKWPPRWYLNVDACDKLWLVRRYFIGADTVAAAAAATSDRNDVIIILIIIARLTENQWRS